MSDNYASWPDEDAGLLGRRWFHTAMAAALLVIAVIVLISSWRNERYIRQTEPRDAAQEQCIIEQAEWLQDWLHWRWVEHVDATNSEIISYHSFHPQPTCQIKR